MGPGMRLVVEREGYSQGVEPCGMGKGLVMERKGFVDWGQS